MCDNLDILYIDSNNITLKIPDGYNGIFFINNTIHRYVFFLKKEYYMKNINSIKEYIIWFKKQIDNIPIRYGNVVIRYQHSKYITAKNINLEAIDYGDGYNIILIKAETSSYKMDIVSDIIRLYSSSTSDDSDRLKLRNEIKLIDKGYFIKSFYQSYVKRGYNYDYEMFSAYKDEKNKVVDVIKNSQIEMPYNLDKQFIYDAFPTFFEKVLGYY